MAAPTPVHDSRIGILWMIAGMTAFIGNDAIVKSVSERLPTAQILAVRGLMAVVLIILVAWRLGALARLPMMLQRRVLERAACEGFGTLLYVSALAGLPLANATAINLAAPMFVALLAYLILDERISRSRWLAIMLGFLGVLLIIQPRPGDFNAHAWLALLATVIYSLRDILTRRIAPATPSILVTLATAATVMCFGAVSLAFIGWTPMRAGDLGLLCLASALLSTGYYAMIAAVLNGELSVVAPFRYTGLLWALVLGYIIWRHVPSLLAWAGILLLLSAGMMLLREQRRLTRRSRLIH
ncbi:MAG: DMT family transporter [Burkholderiaceae bacterium]